MDRSERLRFLYFVQSGIEKADIDREVQISPEEILLRRIKDVTLEEVGDYER